MNSIRPAISRQSVTLSSVAISVESLERAIAWWHDIFGADVLTRGHIAMLNADVAVLAGPGVKIELIESADSVRSAELDADPPAHLRLIGAKALALEVNSVADVTAELERRGVTTLWKNEQMLDQGPVTAIRDSEGNLMTILQRVDQ